MFIIQKSKLWFNKLICQSIIKVWSTFSKVVGVGKAHKYFPLLQSDDSQTAWLFAPDNKFLYWKILWALPKPAIFEKIE